LNLFGGRPKPRLVDQGPFECPTEFQGFVSAQQVRVTSSDLSQATTDITTTNVTGLVASISGTSGATTQSMTYSSDVTNWQSVTQSSGLDLYCPEYIPAVALKVEVYFDTVFGTLIAVPNGVESGQSLVAGIVHDPNGNAASNQEVVLQIGGKSYRVFSDGGGRFAFRSNPIARGSGVVMAGNDRVKISFNGTPLTNLSLRLSKGAGIVTAGKQVEPVSSPEGKVEKAGTSGKKVLPDQNPSTKTPNLPAGTPPPASTIMAIDATTGLVTARENSTGRVYQFRLNGPAQVSSLSVGQGVFVNFAHKQVSLDGKNVSGSIIGIQGTESTKPVEHAGGSDPTAEITNIDFATGLATARETSTGRVFQFKFQNSALLKSVHQGQGVFVNFAMKQISLDGKSVSGSIVSMGTGNPATPAAGTPSTTGELQKQLETFRQKVQLLAPKLQPANAFEAQKAGTEWDSLVAEISRWAIQNNIATQEYRQPAGGGGGGGSTGGGTSGGSGSGGKTICPPEKFSGPFWCILKGSGKNANGSPVCIYQCYKIFP
jgi:hypothetical protein